LVSTSSLLGKRFILICYALALALYVTRFLSGADLFGIAAFGLFLLAVGLGVFKLLVRTPDQNFLLKLWLAALIVRVLLAIVFDVIVLPRVPSLIEPDAFGYDRAGWQVTLAWQRNGLGPVPDAGIPYDPGYYYLNAIVYALVGHYPIALSVLNAYLGAFLSVLIYLWGERISGRRQVARWGAVLVAFSPSLIYWTSQNLKDGCIFIILATTVLMVSRLSVSPNWRDSIFVVAVLLLSASFRLLLLPTLLIVVVASLAIGLYTKLPRVWFVSLLFTSAVVGFALFQFTFTNQYSMTRGTSPTLESIVVYRNGGARGVTVLSEIEPSVAGILTYMPIGLAYYIAGPFPWVMPTTVRQWGALPEMIVWLAIVPLILIGLVQCLRQARGPGIVILIYLLLFTLGTTFQVANMGTLYRMRLQTWIFCFVLAAWGFDYVRAHWR